MTSFAGPNAAPTALPLPERHDAACTRVEAAVERIVAAAKVITGGHPHTVTEAEVVDVEFFASEAEDVALTAAAVAAGLDDIIRRILEARKEPGHD